MPAAPPILRFTLQVLESFDPEDLARTCVEGLVELFGARAARLVAPQAGIEAAAGDGAAEGARLPFKLVAAGQASATLEVVVEPGPDLPVVRQQVLDLVAVVRRAWDHAWSLRQESRRAREDALTGLENRRAVEEYLDTLVQRAVHEGRALAVMLVDLDRFKQVNDLHGHAAGDAVLKVAAACFREFVRPSDRVCRWGGDEFLVVLDGATAQDAVAIGERLRTAFAELPAARGTTMTIGVADVASLCDVVASGEALLARADGCLYAAKRSGRNCCCVAPPTGRVA